MNEALLPTQENNPPVQELPQQISGGTMLRHAREAEGLHLDALAVLLKVPVSKLEALETNKYDLLPDMVFARALAGSVCRTLKIDPIPILERLPQTAAPLLKTDESGINKSFQTHRSNIGLAFWNQLTKPVILAVLALLIGVVLIVFWPVSQQTELGLPLYSDASPVTFPVPLPVSSDSSASADTIPLKPAPILNQLNSDIQFPLNTVTAASSPSLSGSGLLVFIARGSSWVEVIDANGIVQLRKTIASGEVVTASGALPLKVVIGRADTTEVHVRGVPFDLLPVVKDNVARFEVR